MSHSKIAFLILNLAFCIASTAIAYDQDDARFRYLPPLSTNLRPEQLKDSDEAESAPPERSIYRKEEKYRREENPENDNDEDLLNQPKIAMEYLCESKQKALEIQREILKRRRHQERELKKFLTEIDREHKKHIVEIEREKRKLLQEIEREYKKNLKKMEVE